MPHQPLVRIVDDDADVRRSLSESISVMGHQVICYDCSEAFLESDDSAVPGCIVLDVKMPGMSGIELQQYLSSNEQDIPIILLSGHGDIPMCAHAMKMGAVDFLTKPCRIRTLAKCIRKANDLDDARRKVSAIRQETNRKLKALTSQERAVLFGIANGKHTKHIAAELDVSLRTVQFRRSTLMTKLDVESRSDLVKLVARISNNQCGAGGSDQ